MRQDILLENLGFQSCLSGNNTVAEHLPHHSKVGGSIPAVSAGTEGENDKKNREDKSTTLKIFE